MYITFIIATFLLVHISVACRTTLVHYGLMRSILVHSVYFCPIWSNSVNFNPFGLFWSIIFTLVFSIHFVLFRSSWLTSVHLVHFDDILKWEVWVERRAASLTIMSSSPRNVNIFLIKFSLYIYTPSLHIKDELFVRSTRNKIPIAHYNFYKISHLYNNRM